jgi:hypothetical protein
MRFLKQTHLQYTEMHEKKICKNSDENFMNCAPANINLK